MRDQLGRQLDEVARNGHVLLVRPLLDVRGRAPRLARGLQIAALELGERALGEHREARDALDLVAEQLDAHGLGARRREDVEDVAAHRQLAAVADALDARVAGARRAPPPPRRAPAPAALDVQRGRAALGRRHALDERGGRDGDESAGREQAEPACALADEVRRRLEPRAVGDAARRDEPDLGRGAYQPASSATSRALSSSSQSTARPAAPRPAAAARAPPASGASAASGRARAPAAPIERACELRDAGLCDDLVRDGREVGEAEIEGSLHAVHNFVRHGAGALQDSLRPVTDTLLDELCDWLRIPSISSGGGDPADLQRAADWACERITAAGGSAEVSRLRQPAVHRRAARAPGRRAHGADLRPLRRAVAGSARSLDVGSVRSRDPRRPPLRPRRERRQGQLPSAPARRLRARTRRRAPRARARRARGRGGIGAERRALSRPRTSAVPTARSSSTAP